MMLSSLQGFAVWLERCKEEVNLIQKGVNDEKMECIVRLTHKDIRMLNLGHNQITSKGLAAFPERKWHSLTLLNLWGNRIGNKGCKIISRADIGSIQELYISRNEIGSTGIAHISKAQWKFLNQIKLSWNNIGNQSISAITKANWGRVTEMRMNWCKLTSEQMKHFMMLDENEMKVLWLPYNLAEVVDIPWLQSTLSQKYQKAAIEL